MANVLAQTKAGVPPQQVLSMLPPALLLHMAQSAAAGAVPGIAAAFQGAGALPLTAHPLQQVRRC